jgi:hypothetical protein
MPSDPTASAWTSSWKPALDFDTPAGRLLRELVRAVPKGSRLTLFGSAPLQITLDPAFLSVDLDCFGDDGLADLVTAKGLGDTKRPVYVQVCSQLNFRTSPLWRERAYVHPMEGRTIVLPHPLDILIGKLHRLEAKDLKAFRLVRDKTGHPTEEEMIWELQEAVDLFRPGFDEEKGQDLKVSTRLLWRDFFGKDIDPVEAIIKPALARRRAGYEKDVSATDHVAALRKLGS